MPRKPPAGLNESSVKALVESLRRESQLDTHGEALAALAITLAKRMDDGEPVMMTASWARELRQTLAQLVPKEADGGDDDEDWTSRMSTEVRDPTEP